MDVAGIDVITPTDVTANDTTGQRYTPASTPRELHYYHVVYLSLAIAVGVPGNLLVLVAYAVVKVKTSCDWYILHIAVLDLIVCLFRVPTHLAMETGHWRQHGSDALCKFVYWLSQSVITASVILFAFIAIDRYIKVCKPTVQITARFSRNCVVLISGLSLLSALPTFWVYADTTQGQCTVVISLLGFVYVKNYYTVLFAGFLAMLVVVVVCYALIIVKVRNSQQIMKAHQDRQTREKGARLTQATQGNQVGVTNVEHIVPPCKASPPTATKPSSHQEAESASHAMATSLLHPPMKAWQENDNHVHEKTRGVERSSEATTTPLCQENAVFSFNPNTDSAPYLQKSAQEDTIDRRGKQTRKFLGQSCSSFGETDNDNQANAHLNNVSSSDGAYEKSISVIEDRKSYSESAEELEKNSSESSTFRDVGQARSTVADNCPTLENPTGVSRIATGQGSESSQNQQTTDKLSESMKAGSKRRNLFRSNNVTSGDNGNLTPTTQKTGGQALEKSSPKTGQQGLRAFGNFFRRKRNRQVKPATTIPAPVSQRVSETPRSTIPSDDGHTNFSPKLTRNVTVTRATIQRTSRSFRLTLLLMVVTIVFILSWIPPFVAMVWFFHVGYATPPKSYEVALRNYGSTGYILNHFANPIIYIALSSSFRENVSSLWRSLTSRFR